MSDKLPKAAKQNNDGRYSAGEFDAMKKWIFEYYGADAVRIRQQKGEITLTHCFELASKMRLAGIATDARATYEVARMWGFKQVQK